MLFTEQQNFVHGLTPFPGLGPADSYCPCSEDMESWREQAKCNEDHGEIPFSCKGWFSTIKGLKGHCERKRGDPWQDLFMKFLELKETSDSKNEDENESTGESAQGEEERDHNDDKSASGDSHTNVPGDDDSENGDDNESAGELAQGEEEGDHNADDDS